MSEPSLALHNAIVVALKNNTSAGASIFDSFDRAPNTYPRLTLGSGQTVAETYSCGRLFNVYLQLDAWSDKPGFPEVKSIAGDAFNLIDGQDLSAAGFNIHALRVTSTVFSRENNGKISRARLQIEAQMGASG